MYEIMFVEKRKGLISTYKKMLNWENYGFKILSITDNEQQAISFYGEYRHDLIILDLELAYGDGFSLIRKLKALDPKCLIVVLTQKDDYHSVHDAFRLGVFEYLLKKDIRVPVFSHLLQEVQTYYVKKKPQDNWKIEMEHLLGQYRDHGEVAPSMVQQLFEHPALSICEQPYRMIYFRMDNVRQINRKLKVYDQPDWLSEEDYLTLYAARLKQRETLQRELEAIITKQVQHIPYLLLFIKKHSGVILIKESANLNVKQLVSSIKNEMIKQCQSDFSCTIGSVNCGKDTFFTSLSEVMEKHKDRFYVGDGCILMLEDQVHYQHIEEHDQFFQHKIMKAVQSYDGAHCLKSVHAMLRAMKHNHIYPEEVIRYCLALLIKIEAFLTPKGFPEFVLQKEAVYESETFAFLSFELDRIFKTLRDDLEDYTSKSSRVVDCMIQYIDMHLHEKLDVDVIANHANEPISSAYASKLVKQKTGLSMLQLVLKKRMEVSAKMLLETDNKIKDISEKVGYTDQLYFNKTFKKYFGSSPSTYRKKHM